jgi:DNA-binding transcriptional LysR family regulator
MDLKQLKYFRAVVDHGSFRKAANSLHISPPALSISIKGLEEELGVTLLDRKPGRVLATAFGHSLHTSAIEIQKSVQTALDNLNELRGIGNSKLAIGILPYGIPSTMGRLIGRFSERYPNLEVRIGIGSASFLSDRLRNGELDFMVSEIQESIAGKEFEQEPLFRLRYGLVAGPKHPLAGKRNLTLKRIMDYAFVYARTWRTVLENWNQTFIDEGIEPPRPSIGEATDDFFINLVASSNSVAVLPMAGSFTDAIEAGQLVELHVPKIDWASTVALLYRANETLSPDARLLRDETRAALTTPNVGDR